ncbi:tyrosine-type recombinase/integrase [Streptomyces sp. NPDC055105]|uniref:tyrosine-type recombinase/integrase n=1 Tax=Streptomyces sp. NPDC055105 TaxID=3365719 RepID=UPI0037D298A2
MEWSYTVRIWAIRKRDYRKPYQLRWKVGSKPHSESFLTLGLAESRRAQLVTATREGEPIQVTIGLPKPLVAKERDITWYEHARRYIEMKWTHAPGSTRRTLAEAMASVTPALVMDTKGMPEVHAIRTALYSWAFNVNRWKEAPPPEVAKVLAWFERKSLPASALADRMQVRAALDALTKKLDGTTAAASTIRRKRAIFHNALVYAVDAGLLADNPLPQVRWKLPEQVGEEVDPACVPDPERGANLLTAVRGQSARGRHLVAFFGCIYYGAARPAEVIGLPRRGWGTLRLRETRPRSGSAWTDSGEAHDKRGLKHRPRKAVRTVPIPPELVALLRWHITAYSVAPDGHLFRTSRGGLIQDTGYGEVWAEARRRALAPAQRASALAKRPYDLRHATVSTWLSSGVEPQLVAKRAGHSVAVLFRVYAKFLTDGDDAANAKISARLKRQD